MNKLDSLPEQIINTEYSLANVEDLVTKLRDEFRGAGDCHIILNICDEGLYAVDIFNVWLSKFTKDREVVCCEYSDGSNSYFNYFSYKERNVLVTVYSESFIKGGKDNG